MKTAQIRVLCGHKMQTDNETGRWRMEGSTQTRKEHNLNQQHDLDLGHKLNMADSETEICNGYGADGCRTGNKYGGGLWDEGENQLN
jgi:hypothetical protein